MKVGILLIILLTLGVCFSASIDIPADYFSKTKYIDDGKNKFTITTSDYNIIGNDKNPVSTHYYKLSIDNKETKTKTVTNSLSDIKTTNSIKINNYEALSITSTQIIDIDGVKYERIIYATQNEGKIGDKSLAIDSSKTQDYLIILKTERWKKDQYNISFWLNGVEYKLDPDISACGAIGTGITTVTADINANFTQCLVVSNTADNGVLDLNGSTIYDGSTGAIYLAGTNPNSVINYTVLNGMIRNSTYGLYCARCNQSRIINITIWNTSIGFYGSGVYYNYIDGLTSENSTNSNLYFNAAYFNTINNSKTFNGKSYNFFMSQSSNNVIQNVITNASDSYGIRIASDVSTTLENVISENATNANIIFDMSEYNRITNATIVDKKIRATGSGKGIYILDSNYTIVSQNIIKDFDYSAGAGVYTLRSKDLYVNNNIFSNITYHTYIYSTVGIGITENVFYGNYSVAVVNSSLINSTSNVYNRTLWAHYWKDANHSSVINETFINPSDINITFFELQNSSAYIYDIKIVNEINTSYMIMFNELNTSLMQKNVTNVNLTINETISAIDTVLHSEFNTYAKIYQWGVCGTKSFKVYKHDGYTTDRDTITALNSGKLVGYGNCDNSIVEFNSSEGFSSYATTTDNFCSIIGASGSYVLDDSINTSITSGACFTINASNVKFSGAGNYINNTVDNSAIAIEANSTNATITNFSISNFLWGINTAGIGGLNASSLFIDLSRMKNFYIASTLDLVYGIRLNNNTAERHYVNDVLVNNTNVGILTNQDNNTYIRNATILTAKYGLYNTQTTYLDVVADIRYYDANCFIDSHRGSGRDTTQNMKYNITCNGVLSYWVKDLNNLNLNVAGYSFVYVANSSNITLSNFSNNMIGHGIYVSNSSYIFVNQSRINGTRTAIEVENSIGILIYNTSSTSNSPYTASDYVYLYKNSFGVSLFGVTHYALFSANPDYVVVQMSNVNNSFVTSVNLNNTNISLYPISFIKSNGNISLINIKEVTDTSHLEIDDSSTSANNVDIYDFIVNQSVSSGYQLRVLTSNPARINLNNVSFDDTNGSVLYHYNYVAGTSNITFRDYFYYNQFGWIRFSNQTTYKTGIGEHIIGILYNLGMNYSAVNGSNAGFNTSYQAKIYAPECANPATKEFKSFGSFVFFTNWSSIVTYGTELGAPICTGEYAYITTSSGGSYAVKFIRVSVGSFEDRYYDFFIIFALCIGFFGLAIMVKILEEGLIKNER